MIGAGPADERPAALPDRSFEDFFRRSYASVARGLALALGDDDLGRDAAAEGFARALPRWDRIADYRNPAGWVYRVGLNWAISRRRRRSRETLGLPDPGSGPFATEHVGSDDALHRALRSLDVEQRSVVVARYYLDWSEADIAAALEIRPGTVKSRLSRALQRLSEQLTAAPTPADGPTRPGGSNAH